MLKSLLIDGLEDLLRWRGRELATLSMLMLSASCVPLNAAEAPRGRALSPTRLAAGAPQPQLPAPSAAPAGLPEPEPMVLENVAPTQAAALNAAIPISAAPNPAAPPVAFRGAGEIDRLRALQCLAEAVYYEARSESEDGQRAVAQVVLNRVRHPAYPGTVCGVVYQGPMRAGGGCQFTFTCDGSLALPAAGAGWLRARRIAAAALAGSVYAPVGHATHYHTQQVVPVWAYKLLKTAVIGAHSFYRLNGAWGDPGAFTSRYAAREPSPAAIVAARLPAFPSAPVLTVAPALDRLPQSNLLATAAAATPGQGNRLPVVNDRLPQSTVREEYRNSGRWLSDAPQPTSPGAR